MLDVQIRYIPHRCLHIKDTTAHWEDPLDLTVFIPLPVPTDDAGEGGGVSLWGTDTLTKVAKYLIAETKHSKVK